MTLSYVILAFASVRMIIARSSTPDASGFEAKSREEDRRERSCSASEIQVCAFSESHLSSLIHWTRLDVTNRPGEMRYSGLHVYLNRPRA